MTSTVRRGRDTPHAATRDASSAPTIRAAALFGVFIAAATPLAVPGCGAATVNTRTAMPKDLTGLAILVDPRLALIGEGVRSHPMFAKTLLDTVSFRLVGEGFQVTGPGGAQADVRVELSGMLEVSRSRLIVINGRPLESNSARVQVRVVRADGVLIDGFEATGDPDDAQTCNGVADTLAERMKTSPRLLALARTPRGQQFQPTVDPNVIAAAPAAAAPIPGPSMGGSPVQPQLRLPPPDRTAANAPADRAQGPLRRDPGDTAVQPIPIAIATRRLKRWAKRVRLGGVALGMTREDVIAACSASNEGEIRETWGSPPIGPTAQASAPTEPYLSELYCGYFARSTRVFFSPPPAQPVVVAVTRLMSDHGRQPLGSLNELVQKLTQDYGVPDGHVSEDLNQGARAEHYAWVFMEQPGTIACVVPAKAEFGGKQFKAGIPAGGPCAPHVTARICGTTAVFDARLTLMNPEEVAKTEDEQSHFLNQRGAGLRERASYERYAQVAALAGFETREQRANRLELERVLRAAQNVVEALPARSRSSGSPAPVPIQTRPQPNLADEWEKDKRERVEACKRNCESQGCCCSYGDEACVQRVEINKSTCLSGCY